MKEKELPGQQEEAARRKQEAFLRGWMCRRKYRRIYKGDGEKVMVYDDMRVEIIWKYGEEFEEII